MNKQQSFHCDEYWSTPTTQEECESLNALVLSNKKHMYGIPAVPILDRTHPHHLMHGTREK